MLHFTIGTLNQNKTISEYTRTIFIETQLWLILYIIYIYFNIMLKINNNMKHWSMKSFKIQGLSATQWLSVHLLFNIIL